MVEAVRRREMDRSPEDLFEVALKPDECEQSDRHTLVELDEQVDIAVWSRFTSSDRAEDGQRSYVSLPELFVVSRENRENVVELHDVVP